MTSSTKRPVHRKVYASTIGGGAGSVIAAFTIWLTGLFWGGSSGADQVQETISAVPAPVSAIELLIVGALVPFLAGYLAKES